jgi:DNA polymerase III delta prime subunit
MEANLQFIGDEVRWLSTCINTRLKIYFNQENSVHSVTEIEPPPVLNLATPYESFIIKNQLNFSERICLALSLTPIIKPQLLDCFQVKNSDTDQRFAEFGCVYGTHDNGLLPTLETLLFILAGDRIDDRLNYFNYFNSRHFLFAKKLIYLNRTTANESLVSAILEPSPDLVEKVLTGKDYAPEYSYSFPAKQISTEMEWDELVLCDQTLEQICEIKEWIEVGDHMLDNWSLRRVIKPGFRCLFYGPPGTGKTLTATLLGKYTGKEVYRIDLSMVVSKYIGETEKNLSRIFDRAENMDWILFFDEADALFGKRTNVKDAHDRYANQEVSFLLQRVEDFNGLVILSTNMKSNIDEAFARRFQNVIHFPVPDASQREKLWQNSFSVKTKFDKEVDLKKIAEKYELTGGAIINIVRYCSLKAMSRKSNIICLPDMLNGIRREFLKEGKTL